MNGPITRRSEAKDFVSSSAYSLECLRRYMELAEKGELKDSAEADVRYALEHKYNLINTIPHWVFNYYARYFYEKNRFDKPTTVGRCREWVLSHEAKESKQNMHPGYFNHLTNKLMAIGLIYKVREDQHYLIYLENVIRIKGIPWFRRRNERLNDPEFSPEGGLFNVDGINWSK